MSLALRDDLNKLRDNSIYLILGTQLIVALVFIGEWQSYISSKMSIIIIAICYIILTCHYHFKIQYIADKHLDDE